MLGRREATIEGVRLPIDRDLNLMVSNAARVQRPSVANREVRIQVQQERPRLGGIRLFSGLPPKALRDIERQCQWCEFHAGARIVERDSDDRSVYLVVLGSVQVANYSSSGRKIALATIAAGGYFGELAAIDGQPRSATVIALENCLVAMLPPSACNQLMLDHPELAVDLLRRLAQIIRSGDNRIMDLSTLGAIQRVYLELLDLAVRDPAGSGAWIVWPSAQKQIASQASTTGRTVTRAISHLVAEGVITRTGESLTIYDRARLEALAADFAEDGGENGAR